MAKYSKSHVEHTEQIKNNSYVELEAMGSVYKLTMAIHIL